MLTLSSPASGGMLAPTRLCARREQVGQADRLARRGTWPDRSRPARDERDAVPALPDVGLVPAVRATRKVPSALDLLDGVLAERALDAGVGGVAVIAREDDERGRRQPGAIDGAHDLAHRPVRLHDEGAVQAQAALAGPLRRRHEGRVGRGERQVEEERPGRRLALGMALDVVDGPSDERRQHVDRLEIGVRRPGTMECLLDGRHSDAAIVLHPDVWRHVQRGADPEESREAPVVGPFRMGCAKSTSFGAGSPEAGRASPLRAQLPTQMPLADVGGVVAVLP